MDAMKRHGVRPNYETFVNFMTHIPPPYLTSGETLLNYYAQVLLEMKELDIGKKNWPVIAKIQLSRFC